MENMKKVGLPHLHGTPLPWDALNSRDLHELIKQLDDLMEEKSLTIMEDIIFIKPISVNSKFLDKGKYSGAVSLCICTTLVFFLWYLLGRTLSWSDHSSDAGWTNLRFLISGLYTVTIDRKILKSQGLDSNFWSRQVLFLETRLVLLLSLKEKSSRPTL